LRGVLAVVWFTGRTVDRARARCGPIVGRRSLMHVPAVT
jgi:hypothetical protein